MKKWVAALVVASIAGACAFGYWIFTLNTNNNPLSGPIIADHTVVARYSAIPDQYIVAVKKMWINIPGESHSAAYRDGLEFLAAQDARFAVSVTGSGDPESYTNQHLRSSMAIHNQGGWWDYGLGEAGFWTTADGVTGIKSHIAYCETNNLHVAAIGFGWCWDMVRGSPSPNVDEVFGCHWYGSTDDDTTSSWWGLDGGDSTNSCLSYCQQVDDYNAFCRANGYTTTVLFTTGTVDDYDDEAGYQGYLKNEYMRAFVKASGTRVLFDYADILCYNDAGECATTTWNGHEFPVLHVDNDEKVGYSNNTGHIGAAGALRLAKAQWWLLARLAGWDGT